jgi:Ohr subfamily peroxiredoxin
MTFNEQIEEYRKLYRKQMEARKEAEKGLGTFIVNRMEEQELGGAGGATNPEQLFAAAWSACFGTSLTVAASAQKVKIGEVSVTAKIAVLNVDGAYILGAHLVVHIQGVEQSVAAGLVEATKSICSYSKATKGNIETIYEVVTA